MLTPDEITQLRQQIGIPTEKGISTVSAEDRIAKLTSNIGQPKTPKSKLEQFSTGVAKGELSLVRGLGKFGQDILQQTAGRVVEKVTGTPKEELGTPLFEEETPESLKPQTGAEEAGKITADIASFLVPETFIAKTMTRVPSLVRGATQIAKDIAIAGAEGGKEDASTTGIISTATRTFVPAVRLLGNVFGRTLGLLASRGTDLIDEVINNPEFAKLGLRGDPVKILKDSAVSLSKHAKDIKLAAQNTFKSGLKSIQDNYSEIVSGFKNVVSKTKDGVDTIVLRDGTSIIKDPQGNKFNISLEGIKRHLTNTLKEFRVSGGTRAGFDFSNASLSDSEERIIQKAVDKINSWKDLTPVGINTLADIVKGFARAESASMKRANAILFNMASSIDDYLIQRVPKFKELNSAFSESQKFLEELAVQLNAIGKSTSPREIARISSKIQNIFGANKDAAREFLRSLPEGEKILGVEAGRQLQIGDISKASGAIGNFIANLIQTAIPPKAIGEIAVKFGVTKQVAENIYNTLKPLAPEMQISIINLIRGLINRE